MTGPKHEKFIKQMLAYHGTYNGITTCLHHMIGCMVRHMAVENGKAKNDESAQNTYEELEDYIIEYQYVEYENILARCGCELCTSVLDFDDRCES